MTIVPTPDTGDSAERLVSPAVSRPSPKRSKLTIVKNILLLLGLVGYIFKRWKAW